MSAVRLFVIVIAGLFLYMAGSALVGGHTSVSVRSDNPASSENKKDCE